MTALFVVRGRHLKPFTEVTKVEALMQEDIGYIDVE